MPIDKQLNLWPEPTGEDKDKRPKEDYFEVEEGAEAPRAADISKRLKETPAPSAEEFARRRIEYAKRVYPDQPIEPADKAVEQEQIKKIRANLKTMLDPEIKIKPTESELFNRPNSSESPDGRISPDDDKDDPWSEINPPAMSEALKNRKYNSRHANNIWKTNSAPSLRPKNRF